MFQLAAIAAERAESNEVSALILASQARTHATMGEEIKAVEMPTRSEDSLTQQGIFAPCLNHAGSIGKIHTILELAHRIKPINTST